MPGCGRVIGREALGGPGRPAVCRSWDQTFDFTEAREVRGIVVPSIDTYKLQGLEEHLDDDSMPPSIQERPHHEPGVRPARPLPYTLHARGRVEPSTGSFRIEFSNTGVAAAVFQVRSASDAHVPRTYTIEPLTSLLDKWAVASIGTSAFDLSIDGPNGFFRRFRGGLDAANARLEVVTEYDEDSEIIRLVIVNQAADTANIRVRNKYTGKVLEFRLEPVDSLSLSWSLARFHGWYDLIVTVTGDARFKFQCAGHLEPGATARAIR